MPIHRSLHIKQGPTAAALEGSRKGSSMTAGFHQGLPNRDRTGRQSGDLSLAVGGGGINTSGKSPSKYGRTLRAFSQGCAWRPAMRAKLAKLSVDTRPLASVRSSTKARTQLRAASVISCSSVTSSRIPCTHRTSQLRLSCSIFLQQRHSWPHSLHIVYTQDSTSVQVWEPQSPEP